MRELPETRFARNGDAHIAYQTVGSGALDLFLVDTWFRHVEAIWDFPDAARLLRRLSSLGRLIHFDRRGTGLSDPVALDRLPDVETQVEDAVAVLDDSGAREAAVIGLNDGSLVAMLLAATHPERCRSLVLFTPTVRHELAAGMPMEMLEQVVDLMVERQRSGDSGVEVLAASRAADDRFSQQLARLQRLSVRPGAVGHFFRQLIESDVSDALPRIRVPTLVLNRRENPIVSSAASRYVADALPDARFVELPGTDHLPYAQDVDLLLGEIEEFLTGSRSGSDPDRMLTTLLFTDIVDSTKLAAEMGDRRWRDLLDQHHDVVRAQLERFRGREVATTGDGFFATFESPAAGLRCALAISDAVSASLGCDIRAGVHTGEVEVRGADLGGLAVHIGARIAGLARAREVLVSSTVRDLVAGSAFNFEDRGEHELKGVPGRWRVFAASTG